MFVGQPHGWLLSWKILLPCDRRSEFREDIPGDSAPGAVGLSHHHSSSQENLGQLDDDRAAHGLPGSGKSRAREHRNKRRNAALVPKTRISLKLTMDSAVASRPPFNQSRLKNLGESLRLRPRQCGWALLLLLLIPLKDALPYNAATAYERAQKLFIHGYLAE